MIVATITVALLGVFVSTLLSSSEAQAYNERLARASELGQQFCGRVRRELMASSGLMTNDPIGIAYRDLLGLSESSPPLDSSTLGSVDVDGNFEVEESSGVKTGNSLMFTKYAWSTEFGCTSGRQFRIDVYRIYYYYLTKTGPGPGPGSNVGLDMSRFVSEPLANGHQIDKISDPADRAEVLSHLANGTPGLDGISREVVEVVWHRRGDPAEPRTLRQIVPTDGSLSETPLPPRDSTWVVQRDAALSSDGLFADRHFAIASNWARASFGVGRLGVRSSEGDGFPHGFEVQMIGPSFARRTLLHLSLASTNRKGTQAHTDISAQIYVRDF